MASSGDTFEPFLLPRAQSDVDKIVQFLSARSPLGAIAWRERWDEVLNQLSTAPLLCAIAPESVHYEREIRHVLFKTRRGRIYRALFTVVGRGVFILSVRGPRQNLLGPGALGRR